MTRLRLGLGGGVIAVAVLLGAPLEQWIAPSVWALGVEFGQAVTTPNAAEPVGSVNWEAIERDATALDSIELGVAATPSAKPEPNKARAANKKAPRSLFVSAERVLGLSRRASIPPSRYVPPSGQRPAGLQVAGVGGLGIGARDGDVLTKVAGTEVRSSSAVVSLVLKARANKAAAISGEFWRGQERWQIVVEMPYPQPPAPQSAGLEANPRPVSAPSAEVAPSSRAASSAPGAAQATLGGL